MDLQCIRPGNPNENARDFCTLSINQMLSKAFMCVRFHIFSCNIILYFLNNDTAKMKQNSPQIHTYTHTSIGDADAR